MYILFCTWYNRVMPRIKFQDASQSKFLFKMQSKIGLSWDELAREIKVHPRTLFDWRRDKYTIDEKAFKRMQKLAGIDVFVPKYEILPDFWSTKKAGQEGGRVVAKKYGGPGTLEGRVRGGTNSQIQRRLFPHLYKHCNLPKEINKPANSSRLAEFIGILLGDGGMSSDYQISISFHKYNGEKYETFITIIDTFTMLTTNNSSDRRLGS